VFGVTGRPALAAVIVLGLGRVGLLVTRDPG
jgi:hypothetical protein